MPRLPLLVFLILVTTLAAHSQQSEIVPLPDASWQAHWGDDPRCATVSGTGCTLQSLDEKNSAPAAQVWLRRVIRLPDSLRNPQQLGLLVEGACCSYEVFVNGHPIGSRGQPPSAINPRNGSPTQHRASERECRPTTSPY